MVEIKRIGEHLKLLLCFYHVFDCSISTKLVWYEQHGRLLDTTDDEGDVRWSEFSHYDGMLLHTMKETATE